MMIQMDDAQLADVHGQAYVLDIGTAHFEFKSLQERDINARIDAIFAFNPKFVGKVRDGASFIVPRILGGLAERLDLDLGEIKFGFVPVGVTP